MKSRNVKWRGHATRMQEFRNIYITFGKPEGNRQLGRSRRNWEDDIKKELK
jgi:hypothetical protein